MTQNDVKTVWRFISIFFAVIITYLSLWHQPLGSNMIASFPLQDKGAHALSYMAFGYALYYAFGGADEGIKQLQLSLKSILFGAAFGYMMEILQSFVGRDYDLKDLLADTIGLCIGTIIAVLVLHSIGKKYIQRA